ncbi:hypothetical protein LR021_00620 [Candidatus Bipolaricaulota bacterium]|nr:hypothetical protein [Candidatus Bipolaricaulota bacterium]
MEQYSNSHFSVITTLCEFVVATLVAGYAAVTTEVVTTTPIMRIAADQEDYLSFDFRSLRGKIRVSNKARIRFKERVRELTHRNNPLSMYQVIHELNKYLRGWVGYFGTGGISISVSRP